MQLSVLHFRIVVKMFLANFRRLFCKAFSRFYCSLLAAIKLAFSECLAFLCENYIDAFFGLHGEVDIILLVCYVETGRRFAESLTVCLNYFHYGAKCTGFLNESVFLDLKRITFVENILP